MLSRHKRSNMHRNTDVPRYQTILYPVHRTSRIGRFFMGRSVKASRSLGDYRCDSAAGVAGIGAMDVMVMTSFESSPTT